MKPSFRKTWAEVDLNALEHNVRVLHDYHQKELIAVIKANAYGHGDIMLARHLERIGTHMCAVATLDEAINLRNHGIHMDILCMGYVEAEDLELAYQNDVIVTMVSLDWVIKAPTVSGLRVHVKLDTGMNRLGIKLQNDLDAALDLADSKGFVLEGIYTHFASSDEPSNIQTTAQYTLFNQMVEHVNRSFKWIHCANSGAVVNFPTPFCNAVRIGLSLYGYSDYDVDLKPLMKLHAPILDVKALAKGESVGYGASYVAEEDELVGTIGIGYADGLSRHFQGAQCAIDGHLHEYVGRICMDLAIVKLDKVYPIGTMVEILGPHIDVYALAKHLGTIPYEIFPQLNDRIPRVYILDGEPIAYLNARFPSPKLIER